jgi:hypothetical protein
MPGYRSAAIRILLAAGCASAPAARAPVIANVQAALASDLRCDVVEAALAIDDRGFQDFYRGGCGEAAARPSPFVVDVLFDGEPFPETETCPGRSFVLFRKGKWREPRTLRLRFSEESDRWSFGGSYFDPELRKEKDGTYSDIRYLCITGVGHVERRGGRWHAYAQEL